MSIVANSRAGSRVPCQRCAKPCVVAATRKEDARVAREADGAGLCAECIITAMVKEVVGAGDKHRAGWFAAFTVEGLRLPHVQEQVARVIAASGSRLPTDNIDWDEIIANWNLPIRTHRGGGLF